VKKRLLFRSILTLTTLFLLSLGFVTNNAHAVGVQSTLYARGISTSCTADSSGSNRGYVNWSRSGNTITADVHLQHAMKSETYSVDWLCVKRDVGSIRTDKNGDGTAHVQFNAAGKTHFVLSLLPAHVTTEEIRDSGATLK
jgi:hypothetical protein